MISYKTSGFSFKKVGILRIPTKRTVVLSLFFLFFIFPHLVSTVQPAFPKIRLRALFLPGPVCPDTSTVSCAFGILQRTLSFEPTYVTDDVLLPTLLASIAMLLIAGAVFGRAFCGWACPLGFVQEITAHIPRIFGKRQTELPRKLHYLLVGLKHMILFVFLVFLTSVGVTFFLNRFLGEKVRYTLGVCGRTPFCLMCPVPILFGVIPSMLVNRQVPLLSETEYIQMAFLIFLFVSAITVRRSWCRYICPMGALLSVFNKISLLHIKKDPNKCTLFCRGHQRDCNDSCPMGIKVSRNQEPSSDPECILCYNCAESCSNKAVKSKLG